MIVVTNPFVPVGLATPSSRLGGGVGVGGSGRLSLKYLLLKRVALKGRVDQLKGQQIPTPRLIVANLISPFTSCHPAGAGPTPSLLTNWESCLGSVKGENAPPRPVPPRLVPPRPGPASRWTIGPLDHWTIRDRRTVLGRHGTRHDAGSAVCIVIASRVRRAAR